MKSLLERLPKPTLRITPTALQTAETYVRLVAEEAGSPIESTGFLLGEPGPGGPGPLVTDVILAHDQTVSSGSVRISPQGRLLLQLLVDLRVEGGPSELGGRGAGCAHGY